MSSMIPITRYLDMISRITRRISAEVVEETGMTLHQLMVLGYMADRGSCPMSELKSVLEVTTGAVTGLVDRLERHGMLVRTPSAADRRVTLLELTPAGCEAVAVAWKAWESRVIVWMERIPADERALVEPALAAMAKAAPQAPSGLTADANASIPPSTM